MDQLIKILAKIEYHASTTGRQGPLSSGYKPAFSFPEAPTYTSGKIFLIDRDSINQGETGIVEICFVKGILDNNCFKVGQRFSFSEGFSIIGEGEILKVLQA